MSRLFDGSVSRLAAAALLAATSSAMAGPGGHGPDGEHLDGPAATATADARPHMEAATEEFELVARLLDGELSLLVDRFKTNEPVLNAKVQVESGGLKADAAFHADHGDYSVDDPAMLRKLAQPGQHALVITVLAGADSDLLDGTLTVAAARPTGGMGDHGHDHGEAGHAHPLTRAAWISVIALIGVASSWAWWRRR
ncbi:MAG: hypothetical protein H7Y62_14955, partial [Hyphomicrobium sp.]|nr:hypothetical protein [Hyphomicrobium sp.]